MTKFDKLKNKLAKRPGVFDPAALTAYIGRMALGKPEFQRRAAAARKAKAAVAVALLCLLFGLSAGAQSVPTSVRGNASLTNCLVASGRNGTKLYTVQGYLSLTTTAFVQVFQTNNIPADASVPTFSFPVGPTNYFSMDFGSYGCDLDKITVCISTNAATLGIAATNSAGIQCVIKN